MLCRQEATSVSHATLPGPVGGVCAEELGRDLTLIFGEHTETISRLSPALLQTADGHSDFRQLLRHLRSLLGDRPQHIQRLQARIQTASDCTSEESERREEAEQRERREIAFRRSVESGSSAALAELRRELAEARRTIASQRAAWAAERAGLLMEIESQEASGARSAQAETAELARLRSGWQQGAAVGQRRLDDQARPLRARAEEVASRNGELAWAWELIAEQKTAMSGLQLMLQCSEEKNLYTRQVNERKYQEQYSQLARIPQP